MVFGLLRNMGNRKPSFDLKTSSNFAFLNCVYCEEAKTFPHCTLPNTPSPTTLHIFFNRIDSRFAMSLLKNGLVVTYKNQYTHLNKYSLLSSLLTKLLNFSFIQLHLPFFKILLHVFSLSVNFFSFFHFFYHYSYFIFVHL